MNRTLFDRLPRSADSQSAVPQTLGPPGSGPIPASRCFSRLPTRSRRYNRLKACSTVLVLLALVSGCRRKPEAGSKPPLDLAPVAVQVQAAESKKQLGCEEVVGTVRAKLRATLEAKLSGRVLNMPVVLGQNVKAGQLVARLDAAEIKARLDQAEAGLQQAQRDWKRISALHAQQAVTRSEYDAADAHLQVGNAAVAEARAMMGYVEVLAPFDGVVTKKWADVGDLAAPGKPLIDIEDPSALLLEADVPESIASKIKSDAQLGVRLDFLKDDLVATVSEIAPVADPDSRTLRVKLTLPAVQGLMSGQFARLLVPVGQSSSIRVPVSAVVVRGQLEIVFVASNQQAQLHLVKTGKRLGDEVEILAGVDVGDQVVVSGAALLTDGQRLALK